MRASVSALILSILASACCANPCCPPVSPCAGANAAYAQPSPLAMQPAKPGSPAPGALPSNAVPEGSLVRTGGKLHGVGTLQVGGPSAPKTGSAQVTLVNRTSVTLDLSVDSNMACRAMMNLTCTTQVTPGRALALLVTGPHGESAETSVNLEPGQSFTWTIDEN